MNFNQLRNLFAFGFLFDLPHKIKCGLVEINLKTHVFFPELGISFRLEDLIHQTKHVEHNSYDPKKVTITLYNKEHHTTPRAFSSIEEAAKYIEYLMYYINILTLMANKK